MDRLTINWVRRSKSPSSSTPQEPEATSAAPKTGQLVARPTDSTSNSEDSRSSLSVGTGRRQSIRNAVNRLRSSSSASSLGRGQEMDINDIHDWFRGFQRYNELLTQGVDSKEFSKTTKTLTKNCGGNFIHGHPEAVFDFSLLWCPTTRASTPRPANEPSWSWKSCSTAINFPFDQTTCPDVYRLPRDAGEIFRSEVLNFYIGPKDSPYTIRREKNERLRTKYPPYFHAPRGSDPTIESNTLRFTAAAISADDFSARQLHYQDKDIPCSELVNDKEQHCGVIMDFEDAISEAWSHGPYEFVLLSRNLRREPSAEGRKPASPVMHPPGTPIWDGEQFIWDEEVEEVDETVFASGEWKMLNVMLIKWVGEEYAERVAIARIHEDEWLARHPTKKDIVLR